VEQYGILGVMSSKFMKHALPADKAVPVLALSNIMNSARHKSVSNAASYQQDAATVLAIIEREQYPELQRVSYWESIFLDENGNGNHANGPSLHYQKKLSDLARFYMHDCMKLDSARTPVSNLMAFLCSARPAESKGDELKKLLEKYMPAGLLNDALELVSGSISDALGQYQNSTPAATAGTATPASTAPVSPSTSTASLSASTSTQGEPKKKKQRVRKGGDDDLDDRKEVALCGKNHKAKMTKIKALYDRVEAGDNKGKLTDIARQWYTKNVVKPMKCLTICHHGSIDQFVAVAVPAFFLLSKGNTTDRVFPTHDYRCMQCKDAAT
jgi:hypothetical protein